MRILVVRPEPGALATAARLQALGHQPVVLPLLATEPLDWTLPATANDAVLLTSAAAVRHAGPQADALKSRPALCVGQATAAAARAAGWRDVHAGPGTLQAMLDAAAAGPHRRLLHLAGEDRTAVTVPPALSVAILPVYRAALRPLPALPSADAVLLHSPRTARQFAAEWDRLGGRRADVALFAISEAALEGAGVGWAAGLAAATPDDDAVLAMLPKAL
jgi:uroporphyrinogen-III synthase